MLIWRLRNSRELTTILEELDALVDRKLLNDMYRIATSENTRFGMLTYSMSKVKRSTKASNIASPKTIL